MSVDHQALDKIVNAGGNSYGKGVWPNPLLAHEKEWMRRQSHAAVLDEIHRKIASLYEPRFITSPQTSEAIAALITMTDSRSVLELGCHTGFTSLHIIAALLGKEGARFFTVDPHACFDTEFFSQFGLIHQHVNGWTPDILKLIAGQFDFCFIDSSHTLEHTAKELDALMPLTRPGSILLFHDVPAWMNPDNPNPHPVREWLLKEPRLQGVCLPSGEQADCLATFGDGYAKQLNPGLGIFVRV